MKTYYDGAKPRTWTLAICLCLATAGIAADFYVTPDGTGTSYTSWGTSGSNIATAANLASEGDTVWVSGGVYNLSETVTSTKSLSIIGTNGTVVVDGGGTMQCFNFGGSTTGTVANLFITGGYALQGGGIYMYAGTVSDCVFSNNVAYEEKGYRGGGGVLISGGTEITIRHCTFVDNYARYYGGGLYIQLNAGNVLVDNCTFHTNIADVRYAGLGDYDNGKGGAHTPTVITGSVFTCNVAGSYGAGQINGIMTHSTVVSNVALTGNGGGMRCTGLITDSLISDNQAYTSGGGIYGGTIINSIIRRNQCQDPSSANYGGGGVYNPTLLQNCLIEDNSVAGNWGGGVFLSGGTVQGCLIKGNRSLQGSGGGIRRYTGEGMISSCTIVSNYSEGAGGGVYDNTLGSPGRYENNIIYFNTTGGLSLSNYFVHGEATSTFTNCCLAPALSGSNAENSANNITSDPLFFAQADDD